MIVTRTPLRISIGGGGTDLPSYYSKFGSFFISAAIDKYMYVTFYRTPLTQNIRLKYSRMEDVNHSTEISNAIIRETFRLHGVDDSAELASHAVVPGGTGLGTSGSFGVGVSHAIHAAKQNNADRKTLAEEATKIQMEILGFPIGKQDQYVAAFGGLNCYNIDQQGNVTVTPLNLPQGGAQELEKKLVLFFTGFSRSANEILFEQKRRSEAEDQHMIESLHHTQKLAHDIRKILEAGEFKEFGEIMNEHWQHKKQRSSKISNPQIDYWYDLALQNGAVGGKLVGAGGGGFLLFYSEDRDKLISAMTNAGLKYVPFKFDFTGSKVLVNDHHLVWVS
ncbi:MAG: galactokinase [Parcubacteria group bacterium]|nr:galactokinase [Parcubacteria group bacterium]